MGYSRRSHSLAALFNERSCRWVRPTLSRAAARHHPRLAANQQPPLISTTTNSCPPINAKQWRRLPAGWWWRRRGLPGLLIGLSSPLLRREGEAGWLQAGQAEGKPMGAQCGGEMARAGPVIVPVQASHQGQTHFLHRGKCLLGLPSLPQSVAVLVVRSTRTIRACHNLDPRSTDTLVTVTHPPPEVSSRPQ